jgi:hypothetical protein
MSFKTILTLTDAALVNAGAAVADGAVIDIGQLRDIIFELRGVKGSGTALDISLQDTFDDGATWNIIPIVANMTDTSIAAAFGQLTGNGAELGIPARPLGGKIRTLRTSTGNGWSYTVRVACNAIR